jgi:hypothetical protein
MASDTEVRENLSELQETMKAVRKEAQNLPHSHTAHKQAILASRELVLILQSLLLDMPTSESRDLRKELKSIDDELRLQEKASNRALTGQSSPDNMTTEEILAEAIRIQDQTRAHNRGNLDRVRIIEATAGATMGQLKKDHETLEKIHADTQVMNRDLGVAQKQVKALQRKESSICTII